MRDGGREHSLRIIDHYEKDWVQELKHGIMGSFGGQMLARTGKFSKTWRIKETLANEFVLLKTSVCQGRLYLEQNQKNGAAEMASLPAYPLALKCRLSTFAEAH